MKVKKRLIVIGAMVLTVAVILFVMTIYKKSKVSPAPTSASPWVILYADMYEDEALASSGKNITLEAKASSEVFLQDLRIYRKDDNNLQVLGSCKDTPNFCTISWRPWYGGGDEGKTFTFQAQATTVDGVTATSVPVVIRMRPLTSNVNTTPGQLPGIYLHPESIPAEVPAQWPLSIQVEGWDNEGLQEISIFVSEQASLAPGTETHSTETSTPPWKKTCYTSTNNLTCSLDFYNMINEQERTFFAWAEVIDSGGQKVTTPISRFHVSKF